MKRWLLAMLCLVAWTSAWSTEKLPACQSPGAGLPPPFARKPTLSLADELPIPDYLDTIVDCNTPPPYAINNFKPLRPAPENLQSPWLDSEHGLYARILAKQKVDILVAPFQVQGYGLDRVERALMAADLAYAIGSTKKITVADPWVVARALGEGMRRIDQASIERLANEVGAQQIIYGYVGHDLQHNFTLTLQVRGSKPGTPAKGWQQDWRAVPFTDEQTPAFKFHDLLPQVVAALPLKLHLERAAVKEDKAATPVRIDATLRDLGTTTPNTTTALAEFALLGTLTDTAAELARERSFERGLLLALNATTSNPRQRFLEAYTLWGLERRPTALLLLKDSQTAEAKTLRAILDGNLPQAEEALDTVPDSLDRLLLQFPVRQLEAIYQRKQKTLPTGTENAFTAATLPAWQPLIGMRTANIDPWSQGDALKVKLLLDWAFPEPGLDAKSLVTGTALAGEQQADGVDLDMASARHVRRAAEHVNPLGCCTPHSLQPSKWDVLWMAEGLNEARMLASLEVMIAMQGLPEEAVEKVSRYEPLLGGHPGLAAKACTAQGHIALKAADDSRANWLKKSSQNANLAAYLSPGENETARAGLICMGIPSAESQFMADAYGYDYPRKPMWGDWSPFVKYDAPQHVALAEQALLFSWHDLSPQLQLPPTDRTRALMASLGDRFIGSPGKGTNRRLEDQPSAASDPQEKMARLRIAIKADPEPWTNYWALGNSILDTGGSYQSASEAFMSYPGFHDEHPDDPVALSNYAYEAGTKLYWDAQPDLAQPLYTIAANLNTGSAAGMTSQARLYTLMGRYPEATESLRERATRYQSPYAYRDYLSFLYAFGKHDEAWQAFSQINASFELPEVWGAALVGQRLEGKTERACREWLHKPEIREAHFKGILFASRYAVLWSSTDRVPPTDLAQLVQDLEGDPLLEIAEDGVSVAPRGSHWKGNAATRPTSPFRKGQDIKLPPGTPVRSPQVMFADAYAAVRARNYALAVQRFVTMSDRYPISMEALGYFAYAAAHSGDTVKLEKYLQDSWVPTFDYWLARAFFAAARKDSDAAYQALESAFRKRPLTDYRPIMTEYQYAEACEWLYQETNDSRFRENLLAWVQYIERIEPTQSWAYAMEYTYRKNGPERTRALALAHYLDALSPRLKSASAAEIRAADAWFHANNPFRLPSAASPEVTSDARPATSRRTS
jgi:hypothetical protein